MPSPTNWPTNGRFTPFSPNKLSNFATGQNISLAVVTTRLNFREREEKNWGFPGLIKIKSFYLLSMYFHEKGVPVNLKFDVHYLIKLLLILKVSLL